MGRPGLSLKSRLRRIVKSFYIRHSFPVFAHTSHKTLAAATGLNVTLALGLATLGYARPSNINDPFGTLMTAGVDGAEEASLIETDGRDLMALIYKTYRVYASTLVVSVSIQPEARVTTTNSIDFTSGAQVVTTTDSLTADTLNTPIWVVVIPSTLSTPPVVSWNEVQNSPMVWKKMLNLPTAFTVSRRASVRITIPDHFWFVKHFHLAASTVFGLEKEWVAIADNPNTAQAVFYHIFLMGGSGAHTRTVEYEVNYTLYQQVQYSKYAGDQTDLATELADDEPTTVTG